MSRDAELEFPQPQVASNASFNGLVNGNGNGAEADSGGSITSRCVQ